MIKRYNFVRKIEFYGLKINDYTDGLNESSSFTVIEVPPNTKHPEARSKRSDKYYYVVSGNIKFSLEGKEYNLSEKDLCIVHKGQHFSYQNNSQDLTLLILVHTPNFDLDSEVFIE